LFLANSFAMHTPEILRAAMATVLPLLLQLGMVAIAILVVRLYTLGNPLSRGVKRLQALPWHDFDAPLLLGAYILVQMAALAFTPMAACALGVSDNGLPPLALALQVTAAPIVIGLIFVSLARRRGLARAALLGELARSPLKTLGLGAWYYVAALPLVSAAAGMAIYGFHYFGWPVERQPVLDLLLDAESPPALRAYGLFMAITVVPVIEELIFRGVMLPLALRQMRPGAAILCVSVIFAALHLHAPSLAPLGVLSAAFCFAYVQTGSLAVPMVMHMLFNGGSVLLMLTLGDAPPPLGP
jgi:membrane protease YdiL (CAAX protease family)